MSSPGPFFFIPLHLIWCAPQTLLGALFWLWTRLFLPGSSTTCYFQRTLRVDIPEVSWGVSLGMFLFCGTSGWSSSEADDLCRHEFGHVRQSLYLGPLYLLVIGIPSLSWAMAKSLGFFPDHDYEWFYTEAWAEALKVTCFGRLQSECRQSSPPGYVSPAREELR